MDTQETKDNVQELVTRAERINDIVIQTLASLKSETIDISKSLPRLTFEVEELKKTRGYSRIFLVRKNERSLSQTKQGFF
jgi:hypothetical protein